MKALVTGGRGFAGSYLVEALLSRGYEVHVLDHHAQESSAEHGNQVEVVQGDIRDRATVDDAVSGCALIFHLAGKTTTHRASRQEMTSINVGGTVNVAGAAAKAGAKRLVHCSTGGVYGTIRQAPVTEEDPLCPNTPYRSSKLQAEKVCLQCQRETGLPVVIARPVSVGGPRSRSWLPFMRAIARGNFRRIGQGHNLMHMSHPRDVADGLVRCGEAPGIEGEAFNLTSRVPLQTRRFIEIVADELNVGYAHFGSPRWPFLLYYKLGDALFRRAGLRLPYAFRHEILLVNRTFDISKAERMLGYKPEVSSEDAVRELARWYKTEGLLGMGGAK